MKSNPNFDFKRRRIYTQRLSDRGLGGPPAPVRAIWNAENIS